jgi:hypothetical protein
MNSLNLLRNPEDWRRNNGSMDVFVRKWVNWKLSERHLWDFAAPLEENPSFSGLDSCPSELNVTDGNDSLQSAPNLAQTNRGRPAVCPLWSPSHPRSKPKNQMPLGWIRGNPFILDAHRGRPEKLRDLHRQRLPHRAKRVERF